MLVKCINCENMWEEKRLRFSFYHSGVRVEYKDIEYLKFRWVHDENER